MITSYSKTNLREQINRLEEEAQANLTLYHNGQDDYGITRYNQIMEYVRTLRISLNSK